MSSSLQLFGGGRKPRWLEAPVLIAFGFVGAALLGAMFLSMPFAVANGREPLDAIEALFTAVSAVCVTGLTTVSTADELSRSGQTIVLLLIQLGGIGVMTFAVIIFESFTRNMARSSEEMLSVSVTQGVARRGSLGALATVLGWTLAAEAVGFLLLLPGFHGQPDATWRAAFMSVSAFCNAGFDVIPGGRGLQEFSGDWLVALPLLFLWLTGGLGFLVPAVLVRWRKRQGQQQLELHVRMVLLASAVLIPLGMLGFALLESFGGELDGRPWHERLLVSLFQGTTTRTAGFSLVDIGQLRPATLLFLVPFMILGGAPGGTAGGAKITTFWIFAATLAARVLGRERVVVLGRTINIETIRRSVLICVFMAVLLFGATFLLAVLETGNGTPTEFLYFEAASALGTVGLSAGVTATLTEASKILLVLLMLVGRLGPLTVVYALVPKAEPRSIEFPRAEVYVG